jgi:hypothetical protein
MSARPEATKDNLDLDAIETRANRATPGPWHLDKEVDINGEVWWDESPVANTMYWHHSQPDDMHNFNAAFIAHARTDIPELIAEIRRLRAENETLSEFAARTSDEKMLLLRDGSTSAEPFEEIEEEKWGTISRSPMERSATSVGPSDPFKQICTRPKHAESPCNGLPRPDCPGYENWSADDEIERLRALLWVSVLCGGCGKRYRYNRADDPNADAAGKAHSAAVPECQSNRVAR